MSAKIILIPSQQAKAKQYQERMERAASKNTTTIQVIRPPKTIELADFLPSF